MIRKFSIFNFQFLRRDSGVISLGAIIILGSIIVEIGLLGIFLVYLLTSSNYGIRLSAEALAGANSGIHEGFLRIIRNKGFSTVTAPIPQLSAGNAKVDVTVCKDKIGNSSGNCNGSAALGRFEIISVGEAMLRKRKLVAIVEVDATTGELRMQSISEEPL